MKIKISSIDISYFKGIKSLHLDFSDDITRIYGENGSGKSTICDAFLWVLFGRNSEGYAQFSIKTLAPDGSPIPNVRHSVKLSLLIDDVKRDFEKVLVVDNVVRRGKVTDEIKHTTAYYIDGESYTKRDYEKFIADIIDEQTFKAVTDPRFFPSLHWGAQRSFLEKIAGDIDYSVINDSRFDEITHQSQFKSLEEYLQHLSYNIRQVKEKLEAIPARIEEVTMACPELRNWGEVADRITTLNKTIEEKTKLIYDLKNNAEDAGRAELRRKIEFCNRRIDEMCRSSHRLAGDLYREYSQQRDSLLQLLSARKTDLANLSAKTSSLSVLIDRLDENHKEILAQKADIQSRFNQLKADRSAFRITDEQLACPVCGRPYDEDKKEEMRQTITQSFLNSYTTNKANLQAEFNKAKENEADIVAKIASYKAELALVDTTAIAGEIAKYQEQIDSLKAPKTADVILEENPSYHQASEELTRLQAQLDGTIVTDNAEVIAKAEDEILTLQAELADMNLILGEKATYDKCIARTEKLESEQASLNTQLDSLLQRKDIAVEYQQARDNLLESTINKKFSLVSFRLFDTLNDGTRKPYCEAHVKGVPFSDLNSAMKINAGLDILNVIADFYDSYAPVLIDNAESTNDILATQGQQIQLYVSHDKSLTIR